MKKLFNYWKKIATFVLNLQLTLLMGIIYFLLFLPYAVFFYFYRIILRPGKIPLSAWTDITITKKETIEDLRRQY